MKLQFCTCHNCVRNRNRLGNQKYITKIKRAGRHLTKQMLRAAVQRGDYDVDPPVKICVPYL